MTSQEKLAQYALDHYQAGGQWVYECFDAADYQEFLDNAGGDINRARRALRRHWELVQERYEDARAEIF